MRMRRGEETLDGINVNESFNERRGNVEPVLLHPIHQLCKNHISEHSEPSKSKSSPLSLPLSPSLSSTFDGSTLGGALFFNIEEEK